MKINKSVFIYPSAVVQKPISDNPGLKVNRGYYFSCLKLLSKENFKLEMLKSKAKKSSEKFSLIRHLTGIKIDHPELALSRFEQPDPEE